MTWSPIVVGVDPSAEATAAARLGWRIAEVAGADCHFVHATRDAWRAIRDITIAAAATAGTSPLADLSEIDRATEAAATTRMAGVLRDTLPAAAAERLEVRIGRAAPVLAARAGEIGAGLIVVGGKHHSALGRWLGGSTVHQLVRTVHIPILVTRASPNRVTRVLVAADFSTSAAAAIAEGERFAHLEGAALRVIHVVEPELEPAVADGPIGSDDVRAWSEATCARILWPRVAHPDAETLVRTGPVISTIEREVRDWNPDILVLGTHGDGAGHRLMVGRTATRLLDDLPTSTLFVPEPSATVNDTR